MTAAGACARVGIALALALAGCGPDPGQVRICERVVAAFEDDPQGVTILRRAVNPGDSAVVVIDYQVPGAEPLDLQADRVRSSVIDLTGGSGEAHWVSCRFGGGLFSADRLTLVEVSSDRRGRLSPIDLQMLKIWLRLDRAGG